MITVLFIILGLVLVNVLLLVFSCNNADSKISNQHASKKKKFFYRTNTINYRIIADK
jgi:hypothetical protein